MSDNERLLPVHLGGTNYKGRVWRYLDRPDLRLALRLEIRDRDLSTANFDKKSPSLDESEFLEIEHTLRRDVRN